LDHHVDLAGMRQGGLEAEAFAPLQACVAFEIREHLGLPRALRLRQIEGLRDVVRVDVYAEIDSGSEESLCERGLARSVRTGDHQEKRRTRQSAALSCLALAALGRSFPPTASA